jgi:hypothetical protein
MELNDVVILELDVPNANGRTYTAEVGQSIVNQFTYRGDMLGEISMTGMDVGDTVDLVRVSHQVTDLRIENGKVLGKIKILQTPMGNIAKELINGGAQHGFRPRGMGTVGADGVVSDFSIISIDMVKDPA